MKKNVAVILAGGVGSRMQQSLPKQFLKIEGKTILEHTVQCFQDHLLVHEIAIVSDPCYHEQLQQMAGQNGWNKLTRLLCSGSERYFSSCSAINAYRNDTQVNLLLHDAARPLVSAEIIDAVINGLEHYDAVIPAIRVSDTLLQVAASGCRVAGVPDRARYRRAQTPQGFKLDTIRDAYDAALQDPDFTATDDCGVVAAYLPSVPVCVVDGDQNNIKITYPEDLLMAGARFAAAKTQG